MPRLLLAAQSVGPLPDPGPTPHGGLGAVPPLCTPGPAPYSYSQGQCYWHPHWTEQEPSWGQVTCPRSLLGKDSARVQAQQGDPRAPQPSIWPPALVRLLESPAPAGLVLGSSVSPFSRPCGGFLQAPFKGLCQPWVRQPRKTRAVTGKLPKSRGWSSLWGAAGILRERATLAPSHPFWH